MSIVLFTGLQLNETKINSLRDDVKQVEVEQKSRDLGLQFAENVEGDKCKAIKDWVNSTDSKLENLRQQVAAYESSKKLDTDQYELVKKRYMNLLIQNIIETRKMESQCGEQKIDIIYFYSKEDCDRCRDQGTVLTAIRRNYKDDIMVYPLDTDLGMENIQFMESYYNVQKYPSLVVQGEVYNGFRTREELNQIINEIN